MPTAPFFAFSGPKKKPSPGMMRMPEAKAQMLGLQAGASSLKRPGQAVITGGT